MVPLFYNKYHSYCSSILRLPDSLQIVFLRDLTKLKFNVLNRAHLKLKLNDLIHKDNERLCLILYKKIMEKNNLTIIEHAKLFYANVYLM